MMTVDMKERITIVQQCLYAYGAAIRGDWEEIDGRSVRDTLQTLADMLNENVDMPTFEDWLEEEGIVSDGYGGYEWELI